MRSGCPRRPTGPEWMAGSAGKLYVPPCHDRGTLPTWCQMPSWCLRAAGWMVCPMGCVASLEHPLTLEYLKAGERHMSKLYCMSLKKLCHYKIILNNAESVVSCWWWINARVQLPTICIKLYFNIGLSNKSVEFEFVV